MKTAFWFFSFRLRLHRLRSSENWVVGVASWSGRTKPITERGNVHCNWFILPLLLPTSTIWFSLDYKRRVSDWVARGVGRNGNVLIVLTPIPSPLRLRLRLRLRNHRLWKKNLNCSLFFGHAALPSCFPRGHFLLVLVNDFVSSYLLRALPSRQVSYLSSTTGRDFLRALF